MPAVGRSELVARLGQRLTAARSASGWGYFAGKSARIEPTCWTLLALAEISDRNQQAWQDLAGPPLKWLSSAQRSDGLLGDGPNMPLNMAANGLAACLLAHLSLGPNPRSSAADTGMLARLIDGLISIKGVSVDAPDPRQDNKLQGWPWLPDTFSWLEPTSWCLLALKKTRSVTRNPAATPRINEADRLLDNRSCDAGGWNFGNASVLGQDLRPYVPTTALGLLALQDRRADPVVVRSLAYLAGARLKEPSAMALALTALCLRVYSQPAADVEEHLGDDIERAERVGNLQTLAMTLYALTAPQHGAAALHV